MTEQNENRDVSFSKVWRIRSLVLAVKYALLDGNYTADDAAEALEEIAFLMGNVEKVN